MSLTFEAISNQLDTTRNKGVPWGIIVAWQYKRSGKLYANDTHAEPSGEDFFWDCT